MTTRTSRRRSAQFKAVGHRFLIWCAGFVSGWFIKGFLFAYFGHRMSPTELLIEITKESGGIGVMVGIILSAMIGIHSVYQIFDQKRSTDK